MSENSYTNQVYRNHLRQAGRIALIILLICAFVIAPAFWLWDQYMTRYQTLRDAKNVVLNMNLLCMEFYGFGQPVVDKSRTSGMSKEAEEKIRGFSAAEGEIFLTSWNGDEEKVQSMVYKDHGFLISYEYDKEKKEDHWCTYWKVWDNQ